MRLNVTIDTSALKVRTDREIKRLAFNTALALNETAKDIQTAERVNLDRTLKLRKTGFMYRLIKITQFASAKQGIPFAEVAIDPTKKGVLLSKLESGGIKVSESGGKSVAIPITGTAVRPSFGQLVTPSLQRSKLRFKAKRTRKGKTIYIGPQHTFLIPGIGIFQKISSRVNQLIYLFKKKPVLKPELNFIAVASKVANENWPKQFAKACRKPS